MGATLELPDGRRLPVTDGLVIGRTSPAEVVIDDPKVSRRHARLIVESGVVELEDLGSRNGTCLNGSPVQKRLLRDGDTIECGSTVLRFRDAEVSTGPAVDEVEELLFDAPDPLGADLEDEPRTSGSRSSGFSSPQPRPSAAPAAKPPADLVEFEDEIVEVRSSSVRPAAGSSDRALPSSRPTVERGSTGGLFQQDLNQLGGTKRLLMNLLAVLGAAAIGYGAYALAS